MRGGAPASRAVVLGPQSDITVLKTVGRINVWVAYTAQAFG